MILIFHVLIVAQEVSSIWVPYFFVHFYTRL